MHQLPDLPYPHDALEPHIDARTMEIHHGKHHATYVDKLNEALKDHPQLEGRSLEELLRGIDQLPEALRTPVRNHGGGHSNHSLFWRWMGTQGGGTPSGALKQALESAFGSFEGFQQRFTAAGAGQFGSGWAWLAWRDGKLEVFATANQDSPLMQGASPILGVDVWEHAYYLKYQNRRPDYLQAWWNVVDWEAVAQGYEQARAGS
jgi:superoxide dismutase, Fe-Mn family